MSDDQDASTTRPSEGDEPNPEGVVHNLPSRFRFLKLAADELLDVVYDIRTKAARAISTAADYDWNAASDRVWSQLQQTRDYYRAVEREVAISGLAVQEVLQLAQATSRTMDFKVGYSGPWPSGDDKPMGFDEIEAGLAPISPDRRNELRNEIDSQVRLATTKITPCLRSTSEGDVRDFILDLLAVGGERPLLDNEVKALSDWLEYEAARAEADKGKFVEAETFAWERRQIRQMLARLEIKGTKATGGTTQLPPYLEKDDVIILEALASRNGIVAYRTDVAEAADISKDRVSNRLAYLKARGYVENPPGRKERGWLLTTEGMNRLRDLPAIDVNPA